MNVATSVKRLAASSTVSMRLAAIDIGSNSIHMIVAQVDADGSVTTLWRMKEMVGLGRISFPSRRLSREAIERAMSTLARFQQAAQLRQAEKIVAVATSAVREAINGGELIDRIKRELRLRVRVVSAREEARLIYLGVRHARELGKQPHLIFDIGGGSVELIVGDSTDASMLESRKLGAARMTSRFVRSDPISQSDLSQLRRLYARELVPILEQARTLDPAGVIGTSGTMESLAAMCGTKLGDRTVIQRKPFTRLLKSLLASTSLDREKIGGLSDQRKEQIVAAAVLVETIFNTMNVGEIEICDAALREGMVVDYVGKHAPTFEVRSQIPDPRRRAVFDLARRCDWHETHSRHVSCLALRLFDELRSVHGLGGYERELLEYASLLHDIGWHIGENGHHKHSLYLILHGGLQPHFMAEEVGVIANVARYHRKALPRTTHGEFAALSRLSKEVVRILASLLRIADGLDRSHSGSVTDLVARIERSRVTIRLKSRADSQLERYSAKRRGDLFELQFERALEIRS